MTDKPSSDETYKAAQVLQKLLQEHDATVSKIPNSTLQCEKDKPNSTPSTSVSAPKPVPQNILQIPAQALGQNTRIIYVRPSPQPGTSGQILLECSDVTKSIGIVGGGTLTPEAIAKIVAANAAKFGNQGVTKYVLTYTNSSIGASTSKAKETDKLPGTVMTYRTPGATNVNKSGNIKRPMNAFMVWARDYRAKLAASMPNATNSDISIRLGQLWSQMSSEEKKPYYQEADNIKRQHRRDYPDWVYKPSPTRKKEEAIPTQHSVLWARYTQGKGLTAPGETIPNPVQVSGSGHIISDAESTIPWTPVSNSTMSNQVAHPPCSVKTSSDQVVDSTLAGTLEHQQIPSVNSLQVETSNTVVLRQFVCPTTAVVSSNAAIPQQVVSSNTAVPKQDVNSSTVKQTTISLPKDTANRCSVAQQTSFLSMQSDTSTTSITPVDSSSREDAGKEPSEANLPSLAQHKSVGNIHGKDSAISVTALNSASRESFKSISTHGTSSWTSHVYVPERDCIPVKTDTHQISGSSSVSLSDTPNEQSFISRSSYSDGSLKSVYTSDSSMQSIKSSSTVQSNASINGIRQDGSSSGSRSLFSSYRYSSTSSSSTFQRSSSSSNFTPIVSSSTNYSCESSKSCGKDESCGGSVSEKARQSSSSSILSIGPSSSLMPSSSFAKSTQSTTTASSRQELSSGLQLTPSKTDRLSMSSFTLSKTDQSSNVSIRGQESSSSSTNSGSSFIQMNPHADPKQTFVSTFGQYSNMGALKPFEQDTIQEPVIAFDEGGRHTLPDITSSSGSMKRGKGYSSNITEQTRCKLNDIKTVHKLIQVGNTTQTIPDARTENSSLRRLLTATTLPSDFKPLVSPPYDYVTVVDRSLVCNKQPVHGTRQSQLTNYKEATPKNVSQLQATDCKHSISSKTSRKTNNENDNTGNSRLMIETSFGKSSVGIGQIPSSLSSSLGLDTQSDIADKFKSLYHGFLDPYDPFFYEGETLYSEYFPDALEVDVTRWNQYLNGEEKEQPVKADNLDICFTSDPELDSRHCSSDIDLVPMPLSTTLTSGQNTPEIRTSSDSNSSRSLNTGESLSQEAVFSPTPSSETEEESRNESESMEALYNEEHSPSNSFSPRNTFLSDHTYTEVVSYASDPNICRTQSISRDSFSSFTSLTNTNDETLGEHSISSKIYSSSSDAGIQESCLKNKVAISDGPLKFSTNSNESATTKLASGRKICPTDDGSALSEGSDDCKCPSLYDINIVKKFEMSIDSVGISQATLSSDGQNTSYSATVNNAEGIQMASKYRTEQNNSLFPDTVITPEYFDHLAAAVSSALKAVEDPFVGANTVEEELMKLDCATPLLLTVQNSCYQTEEDPHRQTVERNVTEERHLEIQEPCCSNLSDVSELESINFENVQPLEVIDGNKTLRVWKSADGKILCQMLVSPETMSKECWSIAPHVRNIKEENSKYKQMPFKIPACSLGLPITDLENSCRLKAYADTALKVEIERKEDVADTETFTLKYNVSENCSYTSCEPTNKSSITPTDPSDTKFQSWGSSTCGSGQVLSESSTVSSLSNSRDALNCFRPLSLKSSDLCTEVADTNDATESSIDPDTLESALRLNFNEDGNSSSYLVDQDFHSNEDTFVENKNSNNVQCTQKTKRKISVMEEATHAQVGGELNVEGNKLVAGFYVEHQLHSYGNEDDLNTNCNDQQFLGIKHSEATLKDARQLLEDNHFNTKTVNEESASAHDEYKSGTNCSLEKEDRMSSPCKRRRSSTGVQVKKSTRRRYVL